MKLWNLVWLYLVAMVLGEFDPVVETQLSKRITPFQALGAAKEVYAAIKELEMHIAEENDGDLDKRDLLDDVLNRIFLALKRSGLVVAIVKMSLEDDDVRAGLTEIIIDLLEADVIPYYEIFEALKESGLAVEVVKSTLTDPETREGALELAREVIRSQLPSNSTVV